MKQMRELNDAEMVAFVDEVIESAKMDIRLGNDYGDSLVCEKIAEKFQNDLVFVSDILYIKHKIACYLEVKLASFEDYEEDKCDERKAIEFALKTNSEFFDEVLESE